MLDGLDIVMVRDIPVLDAEAIGRLREGGGIVRYGVGVGTIDLEAAKRRGIKVANIPDYGADIEVGLLVYNAGANNTRGLIVELSYNFV